MNDEKCELPTRTNTIGLSMTPTLYRFRWKGRAGYEYTRCGADLLLNGLRADLEGEAKCPVCGTLTRLVIADGKIDGLDPGDAMIHVVEVPAGRGRIWIECEPTHIFDRRSCYEQWSLGYNGKKGLVATIRDYHDRLKEKRPSKQRLPEEKPKGGVSKRK